MKWNVWLLAALLRVVASYDVIVVGRGACGLTAALAAATGGATVLVLEVVTSSSSSSHEPSEESNSSSNTARSGGMIPAAGTRMQREAGIQEDPSALVADILQKNQYQSDLQLTQRLAEIAPHLVEWLANETVGVHLVFVDDFKYPGHSQYRMHAPPSRTGRELAHDLLQAAKRHPRILFQTAKVVGLLTANVVNSKSSNLPRESDDCCPAVTGVRVARNDDRPEKEQCDEIYSQKVILACNGFAANKEMVRQYCGQVVANALYFGSPHSSGDAIHWGMQLGADTAFMDSYQAHASVAVPQKLLITYAVIMEGGFQVNENAERFGNEAAGYSEHALLVLTQPGGVAWNIYDERIHELAQGFDGYRKALSAGVLTTGATINELAEKLGLSPTGLARTLQQYHMSADGTLDDHYGRQNCRRLTGPFYGIKVTGALFHTQGGLKVDCNARVMKRNGQAVPNLYAGGGVAAGISGHGADGYLSGNGLLTALGFGMLAGRHAASEIKASSQGSN